jgi:PAS domain-containing protein
MIGVASAGVFPMPRERIMAELLSSGRWEGELVRTKKDGAQVVVTSRWSWQPDARGTPVAALETDNDITERKHAEEERERLRQLEADQPREHDGRLGCIAGVNQPIAAAAINARACLRWLPREPPEIEADGRPTSLSKCGPRQTGTDPRLRRPLPEIGRFVQLLTDPKRIDQFTVISALLSTPNICIILSGITL